jgi:serine-type D-Ala-D-Ala carboxypeptidase/endopeptidase (penicillin-binding protein 4)
VIWCCVVMAIRPDAAMDSLALRVVRAGVREISGRVIGDASAFEARSIPEGWHPRILQDAYAGRVSALTLNENIVWVTIRPTTRGAPAEVVLEPATTAIPLRANVRTVAGRGAPLKLSRTSAGITVSGSIGASAAPHSYSYIVEDPATFTTGAFVAALRRQGVTVTNGMTMGRTPAGAEPVAAWESPTLETLLAVMNRESVNVIAEHVFRAASRGADRRATGAAQVADTALRTLLQRTAGVRPDAIRSTDGSGLSQLDAISPRAMVQMLTWADHAAWGPLLHASLPLAGESGTLRHRMRYTTAQTNLHAKTGTTNDVVALAGYVTARNGELLAFAMLYNGRDRWRAREAIDAIGVTLANWSR